MEKKEIQKKILYLISFVILLISCIKLLNPISIISLVVWLVCVIYMEKKMQIQEKRGFAAEIFFVAICNAVALIVNMINGNNLFDFDEAVLFFLAGIVLVDVVCTKILRKKAVET